MNSSLLRRRAAGVLAALLVALCFAGSSLVRAAEPTAPCAGLAKEEALVRGHEARRQGDFRLAAQCYLLADEPVLADRALAQNFARSTADAGQGMSATLATAKEQARAIRESMRRR